MKKSVLMLAVLFGVLLNCIDVYAEPFPLGGLLPKKETRAANFLAENPDCDGRGVVVAIFDTGVDPGATGLSTTTDGKPKVIDLIDATGSGDVDTSQIAAAKNGELTGLSKRRLTLPQKWPKNHKQYHIGITAGFDLLPGELVGRVKRDRRREFDRRQRAAVEQLEQEIANWEKEYPKPTDAEKEIRADLPKRLAQLQKSGREADDPGPVFDCVLYKNGDRWQAVVDTDEDGDLGDEKVLTDYRHKREFATLPGDMNFGVNVFDDGKLLSIVADCGTHGTHVAGIVAAHYPEDPERNGVAPGAQIVSIKIGDTRLGSMETSIALERGITAAIDRGCDIINMSYGEPLHGARRGRLLRLMRHAVEKHNIVFIAAAGNEGPALSTVIAPGAIEPAVLGIGAWLSDEMKRAQYSLRKTENDLPYTFSSRGPAYHGGLGVDVMAPGGAVAPTPVWSSNRATQMNGTSMATPNASGCVALLISALKQNKINYTSERIRRALRNTAKPLADDQRWAGGAGLLQVDAAYAELARTAGEPREHLEMRAEVRNAVTNQGVYLREPWEVGGIHKTQVRLSPVFDEDASTRARYDFETPINIRASQPWVATGGHVLVGHRGRNIELEIDTRELPPGAHFCEVTGTAVFEDADDETRRPLFRIPVTVIVPDKPTSPLDNFWRGSVKLMPGDVTRKFIPAPPGATWAKLRLHYRGEGERRFVAHLVQLDPQKAVASGSLQRYVDLEDDENKTLELAVDGERTIEICLGQSWSSFGDSNLDYEIYFHSLRPDQQHVVLAGAQPKAVLLRNTLARQQVSPVAELTTRRTHLFPESAEVTRLDLPRDALPNEKTNYELMLKYAFEQEKKGDVTPELPGLGELFYGGEIAGALWSIFDEHGRHIQTDDLWPSRVSLAKGKYELHARLRHSDKGMLERLKQTTLALDRPISRIRLAISTTADPRRPAGSEFRSMSLPHGGETLLFVHPPAAPGYVTAGDELRGSIYYGPASEHSRRPGGFPLSFFPAVKSKNQAAPKPAGSLAEQIEQVKLARLKSLSEENGKEFDALFKEMQSKRPDDLELLATRLHRLDDVRYRKNRLAEVVQAADAILKKIDGDELAKVMGTRQSASASAEEKRKRAQLLKQRPLLIDALYRKGRALGYMELPDVIEKHPIKDQAAHDAAFEANFIELSRWVDTTAGDYYLLHIRRDRRKERLGAAMELLGRHITADSQEYWPLKKRRDIFSEFGWTHLAAYESNRLLIRYPRK